MPAGFANPVNPYLDPKTGLPKAGTTSPWIGTQPQVNDNLANLVTAYAGKDSQLNRMAATEGLKAANRRGLLNSSMAVDASRDAVLRSVLPIASQESAQRFQKNQAARAFEYGMTAQEAQQAFQSGEAIAGRGFVGSQAALDRALQESLTNKQINSQQLMQLRQIASTEGIERASRELQKFLQSSQQGFQSREAAAARGWQARENVAQRGWQTAENIAQRGFLSTQAQLDRTLQQAMQANQISAENMQQLRAIASTEGIEAANRALSKTLQENDIAFRMREGGLDRAAAERAQQADIAFQRSEGALNRELQEQIASWNLSASDRNAAAQFLTNMETMYQNTYNAIQANTNLDGPTRNQYLASAKQLRDNQLNFVEQMYNIDLKW